MMAKPDKDVARWREVIADLTAQREEAVERVDALKEQKKPLTLSASRGW